MRHLLLLFLLNMVTAISIGQNFENPGTPDQRAGKMTTQLTKELQLDSLQIEAIQELNLRYAQIAQDEILNKDLSIWAMYRQGMRLNKQKEQELKPLLNLQQWKEYEQLKAKTMLRVWEHFF